MVIYRHFPDPELHLSVLQIVALNKTKERMRPYHSHQEDEDPDIKKIKKVRGGEASGSMVTSCLLCDGDFVIVSVSWEQPCCFC